MIKKLLLSTWNIFSRTTCGYRSDLIDVTWGGILLGWMTVRDKTRNVVKIYCYTYSHFKLRTEASKFKEENVTKV